MFSSLSHIVYIILFTITVSHERHYVDIYKDGEKYRKNNIVVSVKNDRDYPLRIDVQMIDSNKVGGEATWNSEK